MKKIAYCAAGTLLVALSAIVGRLDGYGPDTALLVVLGLFLLIASADVQPRKRVN